MSKNNLLISDEERYGKKSPNVLMADSPAKDKKPVKQGVTFTLYGPQVDAFCACSLEVGTKGRATVDFIVKAVSQGDRYGSDVPTSDKPKEVTILLTDAEPVDTEEEEAKPGHEESETPAKEKAEKAAGDDDDEDEPETPETEAPAAKRKSVSPKDAALED